MMPHVIGLAAWTVNWRPWTADWAAVPFHFWSLCYFTLGCIVGSFLNVCIYRLPRDLSVVSPPSHCPHCKYSIPFYLNIPLVTWLALKGRCKNCGAPISPRYFIVELLTGLAFLVCWLHFGNPDHALRSMPLALVYAIFLAGLICATFIDFEHFIIPDEITLGGAVAGFAASFVLPSLHGARTVGAAMGQSLLGIIAGAGIVYAILRLGKLMFGRQRIKLPEDTTVVFGETCVASAGQGNFLRGNFLPQVGRDCFSRADGGTGGPRLQGCDRAAIAKHAENRRRRNQSRRPLLTWRRSAPKSFCRARRWAWAT